MKGESPGVTSHSRPVVLPGGKGVLFVAGTGVATGSLRVLRPGGSPAKTLVENSSTGRYLAPGYLLFNHEINMFAAPLDLNRLELTGTVSPLIEGVAYDHFRGADFDVSTSGTLVYRRSPPVAKRAVMWLDSSGVKSRVFAKPGAYASPRLSPNGKRLALTSESEVWIYEFSREKMTQLTFGSEVVCARFGLQTVTMWCSRRNTELRGRDGIAADSCNDFRQITVVPGCRGRSREAANG